jgi:hypothetical protein
LNLLAPPGLGYHHIIVSIAYQIVGHNQVPHFIGVYRSHVRHVAHVFGWLSERLAQQLQRRFH